MANQQNLDPHKFKPGESGNLNGRPKGSLVLSTLVKKLAADTQLADKVLTAKPDWWKEIAKEDRHLAAAIALRMIANAAQGDVKAAAWVRKSGWGDKLDITSDDKPLIPVSVIDLNPPKPKKVANAHKPKAKRISPSRRQPKV